MKRIFLILLALTSIIIKAGGPGKTTLNLESAISLALKNNHDHRKASLMREKAEEQVWEAYGSSLFPSIEGTATYTRAVELPVIQFDMGGITQTFKMGSDNSMTLALHAEQPLFSGAMFLAVRIAEIYSDIALKGENFSEQELKVKVTESYYNLLLSEELLEVSALQLKMAKENLDNAESMYNAGLVPEYDFIKAKVQYQNMIPVQTNTKKQNKFASNMFKLLLGLDSESEFKLSDSLEFKIFDKPEFAEGMEKALRDNNQVITSRLNTEMQDLVASYNFTEHLPKLNAFANWQTAAQENDPRSFTNWRYKNSLSVGITLKVPIFKGFTIESRHQQAKIDYLAAIEDQKKTEETIRTNYYNSYIEFEQSSEQVNAYMSALEQAQKGYDIAVKRFSSGLANQLEVTSSLVELSVARINYLTSIRDYHVAYARLNQIMGN